MVVKGRDRRRPIAVLGKLAALLAVSRASDVARNYRFGFSGDRSSEKADGKLHCAASGPAHAHGHSFFYMAMAGTNTVILGSGIIGISTAYYLSLLASEGSSIETSQEDRKHHIHLVDPAPVLFEHVASGKAGGFLARNWFSSSVAELGAFSFDLHKDLAEQFDGRRRWGWSPSVVINLDVTGTRKRGSKKGLGEGWDWIQSGDSMMAVEESVEGEDEEMVEYPPWLNKFAGAQPLADHASTAQL